MCNHCPSSTTCGTQVSSGVSGKQAPKNLTLWRRIVQFIFLFIMGKMGILWHIPMPLYRSIRKL